MNIYQKMSAITQEIATVAKNLSVEAGKSSYKAVSEADVLAAVKPIEAKHGIYSYPYKRRIIESGEIVTTTKYGDRKQLFLRIETVYRFVNVDKTDEFIDITTYGDGIDSQDKAPGKGMTYGDKYALLKAYKIRTGDDPDAEPSEELKTSNPRKSQPAEVKQDPPVAPYPDIHSQLNDVVQYIKGKSKLELFMADTMSAAGCNTYDDLCEKNPAFITACWNKWCNK